ncbi:anaerobic ribonucleoside-triphosphate reductase activating protein [Lutibacter citreus]|uniref:anaerobic ribonucleoside-triphosphate reductase activating protein n=1 Tax=Lutibacter citreus TaxID=2138210 RepID=UPI000DBE6E0A|nr:anaerobic ribonucleoside-triphosphate reductase activating protein [Lutibacter citreus]
MNYYNIQVVFQEVPGEISICFSICGCKLKCKGCHSPFLWNEKTGELLTENIFNSTLNKYKGFASTVLFMGGEWHCKELLGYLQNAQLQGFKTCLYSGEEDIKYELQEHLTWLKIGAWNPDLGGLDSAITNQKFIEVKSNRILNNLFIKN